MANKKRVKYGFGHAESEYELRLSLALHSGDLLPSDPAKQETSVSTSRDRIGERVVSSNSPKKFGLVGQNFRSEAYNYTHIKFERDSLV